MHSTFVLFIYMYIFPCNIQLQWEVKAPMPSACFRNICKQFAKLHEAITDLLPTDQISVSTNIIYSIHVYFP